MAQQFPNLQALLDLGQIRRKEQEEQLTGDFSLLSATPNEIADRFGIGTRQAGFMDAFKANIFSPTQTGLALEFAADPNEETRTALLAEVEPELEYTSFEDLKNDFSLKNLYRYGSQLAGGSFGFQAAPALSAAALTFGLGRPILGANAYRAISTSQYLTDNLVRQASEIQKKIDAGEDVPEVQKTKALLAAIGSAELEIKGFRLIKPFNPIGKLIGLGGKGDIKKVTDDIIKTATDPVTKKVSLPTFRERVAKGAAVGAAGEVLQENAQAALSRWQAGLSLTDEDARNEYIESTVGAIVLGAPLGGVSNVFNKVEAEKAATSNTPLSTTLPAIQETKDLNLDLDKDLDIAAPTEPTPETDPIIKEEASKIVSTDPELFMNMPESKWVEYNPDVQGADYKDLGIPNDAVYKEISKMREEAGSKKRFMDSLDSSAQVKEKINKRKGTKEKTLDSGFDFDEDLGISPDDFVLEKTGGPTQQEIDANTDTNKQDEAVKEAVKEEKTQEVIIEEKNVETIKEEQEDKKFKVFDTEGFVERLNERNALREEEQAAKELDLEVNPFEEEAVNTLEIAKQRLRSVGMNDANIRRLEAQLSKPNNQKIFKDIANQKKVVSEAIKKQTPGYQKQQQVMDALVGFMQAKGSLDAYTNYLNEVAVKNNEKLKKDEKAQEGKQESPERRNIRAAQAKVTRKEKQLQELQERREREARTLSDPFRGVRVREPSTGRPRGRASAGQRLGREVADARLAELDAQIQTRKNELIDLRNEVRRLNTGIKARSISNDAKVAIQENNLAAALDTIVKEGGTLGKIASRLKSLNLNTAIVYAPAYVGNQRVAGAYNPKTDTIIIDPEYGGSAQTLLHEATHAATVHTITGKGDSNINVKLLNELFEAVKPFIDPELSIDAPKNVSEFVAEIYTNPTLQKALSKIRYKNTKQTLWTRFVNFVRRMFRMEPSSNITTEANRLIQEIISDPLDNTDVSYFSDNLYAQSITHGGRGVVDTTFGATDNFIKSFKSESTPVSATKEKLKGMTKWGAKTLTNFMPLTYFTKYAKQFFTEPLKKLADTIENTINEKAGYLSIMREKTQPVVVFAEKLRAKDMEGFSILDRLINDSTFDNIPLTLDAEQAAQVGKNEGDVIQIGDAYYNILKAKKQQEGNWEKQKEQIDSMIREFAKLQRRNPDFVKVYNNFRKGYENLFKEINDQIKPLIDSTIDADSTVRDTIYSQIQQRIKARSKIDPYFALTRFGDFKLSYAHPVTGEQVVRYFETEAARQQAENAIQQEYLTKLKRLNPNNFEQLIDLRRRNLERAQNKKRFINANLTFDQAAAKYGSDPEAMAFYNEMRNTLSKFDNESIVTFNRLNGMYTFMGIEDINQNHLDKIPSDSLLKKIDDLLKDSNIDPDKKKQFYDSLIQSMPEVILLGSMKVRKNVRGASEDSIRAFAAVSDSLIRRSANFKYNRRLQNSIDQMQQITKDDAQGLGQNTPFDYPEGRVDEAQQFIGMLDKRVGFAKNPNFATWATAATGLSFHWMMGLNISSALLQITQLPLIGAPVLGSKYGYTATGISLAGAMRAISGAGFKRKIVDLAGNEVTETVNPSLLNYSPEELGKLESKFKLPGGSIGQLIHALQATHQIGKSSIQEYMDLGKTAMGEYGAAKKGIAMFQKASAFSFHVAEQAQREALGLTTFELAYKKKVKAGMDSAKAIEEAIAEAKTTIDYVNGPSTTEATARISQGNIGKILTIFKQYGFSMYSLIFLTMQKALPSFIRNKVTNAKFDQSEVTLARKQVAGIYGASAILGGVQGVPFFFIPEFIYNTFIKEEGEDDFETLTRKTFGEAPFDRLTGITWSSRTGWKDLLFRDTKTGNRTETEYQAQAFSHFFGAPGSIYSQSRKGFDLISDGEFLRGAEYMLPIAIRNVFKSFRYGTEGARTIRGDVIVSDINYKDIASQFIGLTPLSVSIRQTAAFTEAQKESVAQNIKQKLLRKMHKARRNNDMDTYEEAYGELLDLADRLMPTFPSLNITPSSIRRSMKRRDKESDKMIYGISTTDPDSTIEEIRKWSTLENEEFDRDMY